MRAVGVDDLGALAEIRTARLNREVHRDRSNGGSGNGGAVHRDAVMFSLLTTWPLASRITVPAGSTTSRPGISGVVMRVSRAGRRSDRVVAGGVQWRHPDRRFQRASPGGP